MEATTPRKIVVRKRTMDGGSCSRTFKTLEGARKFAHKCVGAHPDISMTFGYAVGNWGDVKVLLSGATFAEIFPEEARPTSDGYDEGM